jgi:hypothetical protein
VSRVAKAQSITHFANIGLIVLKATAPSGLVVKYEGVLRAVSLGLPVVVGTKTGFACGGDRRFACR